VSITFLDSLRIEFDQEVQKTRKTLERVPEKGLAWRPHEKSMTLGRLSGHLAELPGRSAAIVNTDTFVRQVGYVPFSATTCKDLIETFERSISDGRKALDQLKEEDLPKIWTMKFGDKVILELPKWVALRSVVMNHMVHHRAQLGVYLRLLDVPVPGMFGPSADEKL
jgi:uncharacterized damage-inducible protein DinB